MCINKNLSNWLKLKSIIKNLPSEKYKQNFNNWKPIKSEKSEHQKSKKEKRKPSLKCNVKN